MIKVNKQSLPKELAEGGEGFIYELKGVIVKIYKDHVNKEEKRKKIEILMKKQLPLAVVKPLDTVVDEKGNFIGYSMEKVEGEEFKKLSNKKYIKLHNITVKDLLEKLIQIKDTLQLLHAQNIVIGDFNDSNLIMQKDGEIRFIDCDSWKIEQHSCDVCMETFKDPLLTHNHFTKETDYYAFAIMIFKTLTRLHPFGGVTKPEMDILERMEKRQSVIDHPSVIIPKTVQKWSFLPPTFIQKLKTIYEQNQRFLLNKELEEINNTLTYCDNHKDYYYNKYNECPICKKDAQVIEKPVKIASVSAIPYVCLVSGQHVAMVLNEHSFLNNQKEIVHVKSNQKVPFTLHQKIFFSNDGTITYLITDEHVKVKKGSEEYVFPKQYKSDVNVRDKKVYYISTNQTLTELHVGEKGNTTVSMGKVSVHSYLNAYSTKTYCVVNEYENMIIINAEGYNISRKKRKPLEDICIHYDDIAQQWLLIIHYQNGTFETIMVKKGDVLYETTSVHYLNGAQNVAFSNGIIFKANEDGIKGFDPIKNQYKTFELPMVTEESVLLRQGKKFIIINEQTMYQVG